MASSRVRAPSIVTGAVGASPRATARTVVAAPVLPSARQFRIPHGAARRELFVERCSPCRSCCSSAPRLPLTVMRFTAPTTTRATPFPCCQRFCRSRSSVIVVAVAVLAVHLFRKPEIGNEAVQEQQTQCSADEHERLNVEMPMCRHWCHACVSARGAALAALAR